MVPVTALPARDAGAAVAVIDGTSFATTTHGGYTLVTFGDGRTGACRDMDAVFRSVAAAHDGTVRFGSCNTRANAPLARRLRITTMPTVVVFGPDGSEVGRSPGTLLRADLDAVVCYFSAGTASNSDGRPAAGHDAGRAP